MSPLDAIPFYGLGMAYHARGVYLSSRFQQPPSFPPYTLIIIIHTVLSGSLPLQALDLDGLSLGWPGQRP
ncbi:hypothetical protein RSOLAG1IB_03252 [Rhizoctonia solani AG-1 IB]|uniref:Uncharacterized protein n=1 Tax=Thanatephorus cucumeris (strain AG1-IB / isolate 7/3/14) TaxID=1108050 RepID=A0A0B7FQW9_THACB|nr:hypothetical protein RSOLAG1IB_03252 [Rhizoctonia solani AG-1 IB]